MPRPVGGRLAPGAVAPGAVAPDAVAPDAVAPDEVACSSCVEFEEALGARQQRASELACHEAFSSLKEVIKWFDLIWARTDADFNLVVDVLVTRLYAIADHASGAAEAEDETWRPVHAVAVLLKAMVDEASADLGAPRADATEILARVLTRVDEIAAVGKEL